MDSTARAVNQALIKDEILLPQDIVDAIEGMWKKKATGQLVLNFNRGDIQSFEMKEHHRL